MADKPAKSPNRLSLPLPVMADIHPALVSQARRARERSSYRCPGQIGRDQHQHVTNVDLHVRTTAETDDRLRRGIANVGGERCVVSRVSGITVAGVRISRVDVKKAGEGAISIAALSNYYPRQIWTITPGDAT